MARAKINSDTLKLMALFESVTGARLKDCIANEKVIFIVQPNQLGIAIGKRGSNIRRVESLIKKKCIVKEYNNNKLKFIENIIEPIKAESVTENNGVIEIKCGDNKTRSVLIGRDRHNINFTAEIARRHFELKDIKVV